MNVLQSNQNNENKKESNADLERMKRWTSGELLPPYLAILTVVDLLASSLIIPFMLCGYSYLTLGISAAVCLLSVLISFYSSEKKIKTIIFAGCMAMLFGTLSSPVVPALALGEITAIGAGAALICSGRKQSRIALLLAAATAFLVSLIASREIMTAALATVPFLTVFAIGIASRRKASLTTSVACGAAVLFTATVAIAANVIYANYGAIDPDTVHIAVDDLSAFLCDLSEQAILEYGEMTLTGSIRNLIRDTVDTCINLLPGITIALCTVISYFAIKAEQEILTANGVTHYIDRNTSAVVLNVFTSAVFILATVLSFTQDPFGERSIVATVALNICIILSPVLILEAFEALRWFPMRLGIIGLILVVLLIIFAVISLSSFPLIVPLIGASFVIVKNVEGWATEHYSKGD